MSRSMDRMGPIVPCESERFVPHGTSESDPAIRIQDGSVRMTLVRLPAESATAWIRVTVEFPPLMEN